MTAYYLDTVTGSDANAGTIGVPFKTLAYAQAMMTTNDTLTITAPVTAPVREYVNINKAITVQGVSAALAYWSGGLQHTHGVAKGELYPAISRFDGWTDANTPYGYTKGGTVTRSTSVETGTYSAMLAPSGYVDPANGILMPNNQTFTASVRAKREIPATGSGRPNITIRANKSTATPTNRYWNNTTLAWQDTDPTTANQPASGSDDWTTYSTTFDTNPGMSNGDAGVNYYLSVRNAGGSGNLLIDRFNVNPTSQPNWTWIQHSGNTWKLLGIALGPSAIFHAPLTEAYDPSNFTQIVSSSAVLSIADCVATPNSTFFDIGIDRAVYVNFGGLSPANLQIELASGIYYGTGTGHCNIGHASAIFNYIFGVNGAAGIHGFASGTVNYCKAMYNYQGLVTTNNATTKWNYCEAAYNSENGVSADGTTAKTATKPVFKGVRSHHNEDDGFQSIFGASFVAYSCVADSNGPGRKLANSGFLNEGAGTGMELYGCSSVNNYNQGIYTDFTTGGTVIVKNSISYGNNPNNFGGYTDVQIVGQATTANFANNCVGAVDTQGNLYADSSATPAAGYYPTHSTFGNLIADPLFRGAVNGDYSLNTGSPCYRSASYQSSNKIDIRGRRRSVPPSIGAYEPSGGDACPVARPARA